MDVGKRERRGRRRWQAWAERSSRPFVLCLFSAPLLWSAQSHIPTWGCCWQVVGSESQEKRKSLIWIFSISTHNFTYILHTCSESRNILIWCLIWNNLYLRHSFSSKTSPQHLQLSKDWVKGWGCRVGAGPCSPGSLSHTGQEVGVLSETSQRHLFLHWRHWGCLQGRRASFLPALLPYFHWHTVHFFHCSLEKLASTWTKWIGTIIL